MGIGKTVKLLLSFSLLSGVFTITDIKAASGKITLNANQVSAKGASAYPVSNIVDGDHTTYWRSMSSNGEGATNAEKLESRMSDHNRYIDITLDGTYDLSQIKIFNQTDGSFNNYYIYASADGNRYDKIISKIDSQVATNSGDSHTLSVRAAYLRINMAYNSSSYETNLADIELYGTKVNSTVPQKQAISITPWNDSTWKQEWDHFENDPDYANEKVLKEAGNLVARVLGANWQSSFTFELREPLNGQDVYEIQDGSDGTILIRGNNGIALASGFNYYLKNYVNVDYNPLFASNTNLSKIVPVGETIIKTTQYDYRYALNFCTYSYTMSFWNWDEYEAFIDWAAMNGVNLMLDIVGQEEVLRELLLQYNYNDEEIKDYIAGPAYFAWFYMQNMYSFGGPLPDSWFEQRVELGRKMHDRMQTYGIQPVIQGFAGQVPLTFDDKNSGAVLTPIDEWPTFTRPAIVSPYLTQADINAGKKNYFPEMAEKFYAAQRNVFGDVSHFYAADPFHEGGRTDGLQMNEIYKQVQQEMLNADSDAVWVMQQWQGNLNYEKLGGLVKPNQALALDLQSDLNPQNGVMENTQVPWIWNMLHNFGGRMGLDGELEVTASQMTIDYQNKNYMVGIGITPEALENSPVAYELLFDMTWSKDPIDYRAWLNQYAARRAGGTSDSLKEAWNILNETAYAKKGQYFQGAAETVINAKPGMNFSAASTWGHSSILYDKTQLDQALQLLIDNYDAFASSPAYRYDLADVAEQVLCNSAVEYHSLMREAYNSGDSAAFKNYSQTFLEIIALSDQILSSHEEFLVGTWINDARTMLEDMDDWTKDLFEFNARALITTWGGTRSSSLNDYSNRKWAGLTKDYYYKRWQMWCSNRQAELDQTAKNPEYVAAENNWFLWGWQWANRKSDDGFAYETKANSTNLKTYAQKAFDDYSVTTLQKSGGVAEGKVNIAKGKPFTTASATKDGALANITDGSTGTYWEGEGAGPHVLTLDLEGLYQISDMSIAIRQAAGDYPMDYQVEFMDENGAWQIYEPMHTNEAMQSNTSIVKEAKASQLRITMSTRDYNNFSVYIAEVEVFGKQLEVIKYQNIALGKSAVSSRAINSSYESTANVTDGNLNNLWNTSWSGNKDDMYPCVLTVDLGGYANADFIELYFEKTDLPYLYKVEIEDAKGNKTLVHDQTNATQTLQSRIVKIPLQKKEVAKVYLTYTDRLNAGAFYAASPALCELRVLATEPLTVTKNYALGKPVTVSSTSSGSGDAITDGDYSTSWVFDGYSGDTTPSAVVDLEASRYINYVRLTFNQESYTKHYLFDVIGIKNDGTETILYSETGANKTTYQIEVNDTIQRIKVQFKGKADFCVGDQCHGWFDIVELEAIGPEENSADMIFNDGSQLSAAADSSYQATLDQNDDTFVSNIQDQEIAYQLDGNYYIDHVNLTFEKAGLGLKYVIYTENAQGERTLVVDRSNSTALLENRTIRIDVNQPGTKLIFKHLGNNGKGDSYLAETRLYETRIYGGTPTNTALGAQIDPNDAQAIIDDDLTTSYQTKANTPLTITLPQPADLSMGAIYSEMAAANYLIEVFDLNTNEWKTVYDGKNQTKLQSEKVIVLSESIFSDRVRITTADALVIKEFKLFKTDKRAELSEKITELEDILAAKQYNDMNGSYTLEAKTKIEAKLNEAKNAVANAMSSKEVAEWIQCLEAALKEFYRDGVVYVDRSVLLLEINHTDIIKNEIAALGNDNFKNLFDAPYQKAFAKYEQYMITQADIDQAAEELKNETEAILAQFDLLDQYRIQLALAKKLSENAVIDDRDGAYPQDALDAFNAQIQDIESDFAQINAPADAQALIDGLKNAIDTFEATKITIDRTDLLALLNTYQDLKQADFDVNTWNTYQTAIQAGQTLYDTAAIAQSDLDDAIAVIEAAYAKLQRLDRSDLRKALDVYASLKEQEYTTASWQVAQKANEKANQAYASEAITQNELDNSAKTLMEAIAQLEKKGSDLPLPDENQLYYDENGSDIFASAKRDEALTFYTVAQTGEQIKEWKQQLSDASYFDNHTLMAMHQFYFQKDGQMIPQDAVIYIPVADEWKEKKLQVIQFHEDGTISEISSVVQGGYLYLSISSDGYYAITSQFEPQVPDQDPVYVDQITNNDSNVTIIGKFPSDVKLIVDKLNDASQNDILSNLKNAEAFKAYTFEQIFDIYMLRNMSYYTPQGMIKIKIPLNDALRAKRYLGIVYISDGGVASIIPSQIEGDYITFTTNHNSYYALISSDTPITNTAAPMASNTVIPSLLIMGGAIWMMIQKIKKETE